MEQGPPPKAKGSTAGAVGGAVGGAVVGAAGAAGAARAAPNEALAPNGSSLAAPNGSEGGGAGAGAGAPKLDEGGKAADAPKRSGVVSPSRSAEAWGRGWE